MYADPWVMLVVVAACVLMYLAIRRDARGAEDAHTVSLQQIDAMIANGEFGRAEDLLIAKLRSAPDDDELKSRLDRVRLRR